jgi:hypothetical protein
MLPDQHLGWIFDNTCNEDARVHALALCMLAMTGERETDGGAGLRATVKTHDKAREVRYGHSMRLHSLATGMGGKRRGL